MLAHSLTYVLHLLSALIWVGGMFFAWMVLRPAAVAALEGPARLRLWEQVFTRFFRWVWLAVIVLPVSGIGMLHLRKLGIDSAPHYVQSMMGLYLAMLALFLRIQLLQLPQLRQAIAAEHWPQGAEVLGRIRRVVGFNLLLGMLVVCIAATRPAF